MSERTINLDELERELQAIVDEIAGAAIDAAVPAMKEATDHIISVIPGYPTSPTKTGTLKFATPKARRWFFQAVKQGRIPGWEWKIVEETLPNGKVRRRGHPEGRYRQSGQLGKSITAVVTQTQDGVTGEIGTNTPYAPWVIGPSFPGYPIRGRDMYQSRAHEERWWQLETVVVENSEDAWDIFEEELISGIRDRLGSA